VDPAVQYALAAKYAGRFDMKSAAEHYQKLLELDPTNALGHNEEAEYTLANNAMRAERSSTKMEAFVAKYPNSPMMRNALGTLVMSALKMKDAEAAKKYFAQYEAKYPDDAMMMNNYAWECAGAKINLDHAAEVSKKAVSLAKTDNERAMLLDTQATVEFERGNTKEAIALEEKALSYLKNATPKERKEYEASLEKFKSGKK
jgi:tetratricopeptide (TPR) repeat protein